MVVVDVQSGAIVALVGSRGLANPAGYVNAATAWRQAGSVLKPFLYEMYFDSGHRPDEFLADAPRCFREKSQLFCPQNNSGEFKGRTTPHEALASSLNVPAVAVLERVGVEPYLNRLKQRRLVKPEVQPERVGLGLALGDVETNLLGLSGAFASLVRRDQSGAAAVLNALSDGEARRAGFGDRSFGIPREIAFKTGTSTWGRDLWAIGTDKNIVVGVWLGNADGEPTTTMAIESAAEVMANTFAKIRNNSRSSDDK